MPAPIAATPRQPGPTPRRADHVRNRAAIIAAAQAVLAEQGPDAPVAEIVRRAGFAKGTFFRHFATKEALFQALLAQRMTRLADIAREINAAHPPGWATVSLLMERFLAEVAGDQSLGELAERSEFQRTDEIRQAREHLIIEIEYALHGAQAIGEVRADLSATDLPPIVLMISRSTSRRFADHPNLGLRYLRLFLDGIRAANATDLGTPALRETDG